MPDHVLTEEPLQFGEGGRLFGVLTLPDARTHRTPVLPVFVLLNAGALHRVGPFRLHVRLARALAQAGFSALRVDLAGNGDSPRRPGLTHQESVAADYREIAGVLDSRLGRRPIVLGGLCSGADNAVRLAPTDPRIIGMVLLDPICYQDSGFRARALALKYSSPGVYVSWLRRRWKALNRPRGDAKDDELIDYLAIRNLPTREQMKAAFTAIGEREGRVLSLFTQYALSYYNHEGQLGKVLGVEGYQRFCTERFWPKIEHTYPLELHRQQLIEHLRTWATRFIHPQRKAYPRAALLQAI